MSDHDSEEISWVSAKSVAVAMELSKELMPTASERRRLLMILGNAAASCGMLRIPRDDVIAIVSGMYQVGLESPSADSLFERRQ